VSNEDKYFQAYISECLLMLSGFNTQLASITIGHRDADTLYEAFRLAHSIKSSSLMAGYDKLASVAELMEQALEPYTENEHLPWPEMLSELLALTAFNVGDMLNSISKGVEPDYESIIQTTRDAWDNYRNQDSTESTITEQSHKIREELDDVVADFFKIEAEEHLKTLRDGFLALEKDPGDKTSIEEVFRAAHTLKGAASSVGFESTEVASHAIEDVLEPIRDGELNITPNLIDKLLGSLDALSDTFKYECDKDPRAQEVAHEIGKILSIVSGKSAEEKPSDTQLFFAKEKKEQKIEENVFVRLSKLDSLMNLAGELLVQRSRLEDNRLSFNRISESIRLSLRRLSALNADLSEQQLQSRTTQAMRVGSVVDNSGNGSSKYASEFDELELDRYNELDRIINNEYEIHADLTEALSRLEHQINELGTNTNVLMQNVSSIQTNVISTRLIPLSQVLDRFPRMVRDIARSEGKLVNLEVIGEDVELDIKVIRSIFDPLLHIVRNAVHHGIESPDIREAIGKPKQGNIRIEAKYFGNQVSISVSNDGMELDTASIAARAIKMGVVSQATAETMTTNEINNLIFASGLSTSEETGMVAGRGIGLDVVKNNVEAIGGFVSVNTNDEQTSFNLTIPISLVISQGIVVTADKHTFVIPLGMITEVVNINRSDVTVIGSGPVVRIREELYPVYYLDEQFDLGSSIKEQEKYPAIITLSGGTFVALAVSSIPGRHDMVIKSMPLSLQDIPAYSGATIFGSGRVVPVINVHGLISREHFAPKIKTDTVSILDKPEAANVLVVDDSLSMRKILQMDLENAGFKVHTASTGLEALDLLEQVPIDILILDLEMPEMDGFELMSVLRDDKNLSKIPNLVITSRAGSKHRNKAFELGADAYLVKPYNREIVLDTLKKLVQGE